MRTYRLEFNEKQQNFHLNRGTHQENTHGWKTICEHITDYEWRYLRKFIEREERGKMKINDVFKIFNDSLVTFKEQLDRNVEPFWGFVLNIGIGTGDITEVRFDKKTEMIDYLDELNRFNCVWLWADDGEDGEIVVSENLNKLIECVKNGFFNIKTHFFIQEYETFESAYSVALSMKEAKPNCYD